MKLLANFLQKLVPAQIGFDVSSKPVVLIEVDVLMDREIMAVVVVIKEEEEVHVVVVEGVVVNQDEVADNVIMLMQHLIITLALAVAIL